MPFKSENQRKWMYANKPKMAKRWQKETQGKPTKRKKNNGIKKTGVQGETRRITRSKARSA